MLARRNNFILMVFASTNFHAHNIEHNLMSFEHLAVMYTDFESVDVHTSRNKHLNIEFSMHGAFL